MQTRLLITIVSTALLTLWPPALAAQDLPEIPPQQQEMELALSAAPEHLREAASVYVLTESGYEKVRDGSNGFTCIVYRDHPLSQKPTCWDAEGTETIVPRVLFEGELMMQGKSRAEIVAAVNKGFEDGRFISPRRPGVAYMLSPHIKRFIARTGETGTFPPHVMFYAPNLTNADIGVTRASFQKYKNHPSVAYRGPHGYLIFIVDERE